MRAVRRETGIDAIMGAIHVDEVGVETGRWRDYFIKSAYRPLYATVEGILRAVAVEAVAIPMIERQPRPLAELLAAAGDERAFVEALCVALHVRNHANIGDDDLHLVLDCRISDAATAAGFIETLPAHFEYTMLRPGMVVCIVADSQEMTCEAAAALARSARRHEMRIGLSDFGAGRDAPALLDTIGPDMVFVDPALVRAIGPLPRGRDLLGALAEALHAGGMEVVLAGISTPMERDAALAAGADLVGGPLLADARLAGSLVEPETIDPRRFSDDFGNVVYLRR